MAIVTPTDRPKSVRNRYVIQVFGGVFVLSRCFLDFSVGVGACHRTESDLFLFLLLCGLGGGGVGRRVSRTFFDCF